MNHRDAYLSDVTIVLRSRGTEHMEKIVTRLKEEGLEVDDVNHDACVVEGTIPAYKVEEIKKFEEVSYVRVEMSYIADYPAGDPRDLDGREVD